MTAPRARKTAANDSFDAFWAAQAKKGRTTVIRGVTVPIPADLPLAFELRADELQESTAEADIRELLTLLFGTDHFDEWRSKGMGLMELKTVLAWGAAQGSGRDVTFAEALEAVKAGEDGEGKAPSGQNRAARRAAPTASSKSTGGRSARTSGASTGSARTGSRA